MNLPSAADLIDIVEQKRQEQRLEEIGRLNKARIKRDIEIKNFKHSHFDEDMIENFIAALNQAAEAGKLKTIAYRFSSEVCSDNGRSTNNALPKWEDTLVGQPREFFEFYRQQLRPKGFRLHAEILNYPSGRIGEVGLSISWETPISDHPKSSDLEHF